jgi:N-acetylglucosaminyl-diphospho-decaprenol L-rhamnosyltransferase
MAAMAEDQAEPRPHGAPSANAAFGAKRLSMVLITWNQKAVVQRCLDSLKACLDLTQDEIIVIDNGSSDGTTEMIHNLHPEVLYRRLERNFGVAPARNRGILVSSGAYVMTLDNDTVVNIPHIAETIEQVFAKYPKYGIFGFSLKNPDGTTQKSARRFPTVIHPLAARVPGFAKLPGMQEMLDTHFMQDVDFEHVTEMMDVDYVLGANQVFRREVFADVGGYDDAIFYGPEDFEICFRARQIGWSVGWYPQDTIVHDYQRMTRKFSMVTLKFIFAYFYVFLKHRMWWKFKTSTPA